MKELSQKQRIIRKLKRDGFVTRNECLRRFISRLGAIICTLNKEGWKFHAYDKDGDYVYEVINTPWKTETYYVPELGKTIVKNVLA